jgi:hypothetical protein
LPLIAYGLIYTYWLAGVGAVLLFAGVFGMGLEPSVDPEAGHDGHHEPEPGPEPPAEADAIEAGVGAGAGGAKEESP